MIETGFQRPRFLECDYDTLKANFGRFTAQPFERGFGVTIGNALRRILLSSITGAAITNIRIQGVLHEFSSLNGVREDVTDVILNLKSIPLKALYDCFLDLKIMYLPSGVHPITMLFGPIRSPTSSLPSVAVIVILCGMPPSAGMVKTSVLPSY